MDLRRTAPVSTARRGDGFWLVIAARLGGLGILGLLIFEVGRLLFFYLGFGPMPGRTVPTLAAERPRPVPRVVSGTVVSQRARGIGSLFSGKVAGLEVQRGQRVTRGQFLFRMDVTDLRRRLDTAQATEQRLAAEVRDLRRNRTVELAGLREEQAFLRAWIGVTAQEQTGRGRGNPHVRLAHGGLRQPTTDELKSELVAAKAHFRKREKEWHLAVVAAIRGQRQAQSEAARLEKLIRQAKRYSPITGVVTSVRAGAGDWVKSGSPVVRVDDPAGYRVVTLVRERVSEALEPGTKLNLQWPEQQATGTLEKQLPGWDHQLFYTWMWLKPSTTAGLFPDQQVDVVLPGT